MELALLPTSGWELPIKTEAVRPFKYLLFDLLHVTAEKNSAIDPQPIPFDHRNSVFTIKGMGKRSRFGPNSPATIWRFCHGQQRFSIFSVFQNLLWSYFTNFASWEIVIAVFRFNLISLSLGEWVFRLVIGIYCLMQIRLKSNGCNFWLYWMATNEPNLLPRPAL